MNANQKNAVALTRIMLDKWTELEFDYTECKKALTDALNSIDVFGDIDSIVLFRTLDTLLINIVGLSEETE